MITKEDIYTDDFWRLRDLCLKDLEILDKKKADWNKTNKKSYLPLHLALMGTKNEELIEFVLDKTDSKHINATVGDYFNWNCLFFALRFGHSFCIFKKLIEKGASYKKLDCDGNTLLVQARKNKEVLQYLLQIDDGFLSKHEIQSYDALDSAMYDVADPQMFQLLLEFGTKLDTKESNALLFSAVYGENVKAVRFLLEHADKEILRKPNEEGETIHEYIERNKTSSKALELIKELIEKELPQNCKELEQYIQDQNMNFEIDESLSDFKLATSEYNVSEDDADDYLKIFTYTLNGKLEPREDEYDPITQTHIELRDMYLDLETSKTINKINEESTKRNFAFALRYRSVLFDPESIIVEEVPSQDISGFEAILKHEKITYFYKLLDVRKSVQLFAIAHSDKELEEIRYLARNLKIVQKGTQLDIKEDSAAQNVHFDIDSSLGAMKLAQSYGVDEEGRCYDMTKVYTHDGIAKTEEDWEFNTKTHIMLLEREYVPSDAKAYQVTTTFAQQTFGASLRNTYNLKLTNEQIAIEEVTAEGIKGFETTWKHKEKSYFLRILKLKKVVIVGGLAHTEQELEEIKKLARNLKIVPTGENQNSTLTPTWEELPNYVSHFPFGEKDLFAYTLQGKEKEGRLFISEEDVDFDKERVVHLVEACIKQTDTIEQRLYDFAIECFEAVDWELEESIPRITDDPKILNADEKTQFLYMMNIKGAKGILALHSGIDIFLDIDNSKQYTITLTFYSSWEEEHGCEFLLKEGEELICQSLEY